MPEPGPHANASRWRAKFSLKDRCDPYLWFSTQCEWRFWKSNRVQSERGVNKVPNQKGHWFFCCSLAATIRSALLTRAGCAIAFRTVHRALGTATCARPASLSTEVVHASGRVPLDVLLNTPARHNQRSTIESNHSGMGRA